MEFRLLGPVEVIVDGDPVQLGGRQRRTVLSILLVNAGESVSTDRIIGELWGESPPDAARKTVQAHIAHLRKALNFEREILIASAGGYSIHVDAESLDTERFEELVEEARSLRTEAPRRSADMLGDALGLFRGAPLSDVADDAFSLRVEASRLEELRLAAVEDRLDAQLAAGDGAAVIAEAERLVAEHPLRERLWAMLMLALYRARRQGDALRAFARVRQVLAEELGIEPSSELQGLEQQILEHDPALTDTSPVDVVRAATSLPSLRNPYKGLRAFDEADAADFFGREELVRRLLERLDSRVRGHLVVLAGPSGGGKSSAVRAGLIPGLRHRGAVAAVMFPGSDPFGALANATEEATGDMPGEVRRRLETGELLTNGPLIVVVDQFEELFTMTDPEEADRFLRLLSAEAGTVRWVVTVRADFLDRMLQHPLMGPRLEEALLLVPPLQEHELSAAVVNPAHRVGVDVDPVLVSEIIRDVRARPAALPLLQYALTDTFERRRGEALSAADYGAAGGISGALSRRADELYEGLDPIRREAVRQLLLALVAVTDEGEEVRRRVDRGKLMSLPVDGKALQSVIERLGAQRLLTFDQDPQTGHATVEVAHEALISEWPRLARWVEDSRQDLGLRQRITAAAEEWQEAERDSGFLLSGSRLDQCSGWASATDLELTALERDYLDFSLKANQVQQRRASRTRRLVAGGVAIAIIVATGLAVLALSQREATNEQARIVRAADLAAAANDNLGIDPERSILLAMAAVETTRNEDGTVLTVAEEALHRAVLASRLVARVPHGGQGIAHFSPDAQSFVTSTDDPTAAGIWSVQPFATKLILTGHTDEVVDAVFNSVGDRVATTSFDGTVRVWDSITGEPEMVVDVDGAPPLVPVFSTDGSLLAATSADGTVWVWDLETEQVIWELAPPEGTDITLNLEFSPDDSLLAVTRVTGPATEEPGPLIFDMGTGELVRMLEGHQFDVSDIGFTPDGRQLVTSSFDTTLKVWDVDSGTNIGTYFGHEAPVIDLQISADGSTVASSGRVDVLVWDLATFQTNAEIVGHVGEVDGIDLSSDGERLLTASRIDGTTRLWDLTPYWSHELVGLPGPTGWLGGVAYSPDGATLAASRETGMVTLWEPLTGRERATFEGVGPVSRIGYSPDGTRLATAGIQGIRLHDASSGEDIATLVAGLESSDVAFSSQGMLATAAFDEARIWRPPIGGEGELVSTLGVYSAAFAPGGEILALSLDDGDQGMVEIRDLNSGETLATLFEHARPVMGLVFDHDGKYLATASEDTTAIIWDAASFTPVHVLEGHTGPIFMAAFDPSRPEVATASADGTIKIWNVGTGLLRMTLPAGEALSDLAYSPDGLYLAAISPEGFVTVYMLDVDELLREAQTRLTRWWTEAECLQYLRSDECPERGS